MLLKLGASRRRNCHTVSCDILTRAHRLCVRQSVRRQTKRVSDALHDKRPVRLQYPLAMAAHLALCPERAAR